MMELNSFNQIGVTLTQDDLNDIDPDLSNSLQWMLENKLNAEELLQEFSFEFRFLDNFYTIDLNEELANQKVNEDNKKLFVKQLIYHKLSKSIEVPLAEIKAGILEFVPLSYLKLLSPANLHSLLAGESTINIGEMKKYAKLGDVPPSQEIIGWFWEIVNELEKDQLPALLFFITGNKLIALVSE